MNSRQKFLQNSRFNSLDGLRAISVLGVIWHHTGGAHSTGVMAHIGAHGVNMFFAISGFLITSLLLREMEKSGTIDLRAFYIRRLFRIFPLYYLTLLVYVGFALTSERHTATGQAFFSNLPYFLTFTSNLFVTLSDKTVRTMFYYAWSVATEEQYYIIWPSLVLFFGATWAIVPALAGLLLGAFLTEPNLYPVAILMGSALAIVLHHPRTHGLAMAVVQSPLALPASLVATVCCLTLPGISNWLLGLSMGLFVCLCAAKERHFLSPLLDSRPLVYLGTISYGLYMLHALCKHAALKLFGWVHVTPNGPTLFVAATAVSVVFAGLSYRYFESYFLRLKRKYER